MNLINQRQKDCIQDILVTGTLSRELASDDFRGSKAHDSRTVTSLIDRGVFDAISQNKNKYPLSVRVNHNHELVQHFGLIGQRVFFASKSGYLAGPMEITGLAYKANVLHFSISIGYGSNHLPVSSIRRPINSEDINFCHQCQKGIMNAYEQFYFPEIKAGSYYRITCSQCGHTNGLDWHPNQIRKTGLINIFKSR